ncbi:MAG: sensor histidine kinase [Actinomycetota bacterium]
MTPTSVLDQKAEGFRHEALFYGGSGAFVERITPFLQAGVDAGEPILVVLDTGKIELLRSALNGRADHIRFEDMAEVGSNPARIIPVWQAFVDEHAALGRPFRAVGEPIWPARSADELAECEQHESLLNVAFGDPPAWRLLCPYDVVSLPPAVLAEARRNHPFVDEGDGPLSSSTFRGLAGASKPFEGSALPEPPGSFVEMSFDSKELRAVRTFVAGHAARLGLGPARIEELVLAVNEVASNSVLHASGEGDVRMWRSDGVVVSEIRDTGRITDPLVGRRRPQLGQDGGFGLWLANQFCDLVQIRSAETGSVVRLHVKV